MAHFVLYAQPRTGSTLLGSLLDSHPRIAWGKEPLHPRRWRSPRRKVVYPMVLRHQQWYLLAKAFRVRPQVYGCKLPWCRFDLLLRAAGQMNARGWKAIYLTRRDVFTQILSLLVARQSNRWQRRQNQEFEPPKVFIPVEDMLAEVQLWMTQRKEMERKLEDIPHLELVYEDDLADPASWHETANRVFQFLGLPPAPVSTKFEKVWKQPYSEIVVNYTDLVAAVEESQYAPCLPTSPTWKQEKS
jgi:LPS sulfotransferase NodH